MKGLNQAELEQICSETQTWVGSQLQDVLASETHIALGFYHQQKVHWMMFDFGTQSPVFLILDEIYVKKLKKQTKPMTLFIRAHFEGKRISKIELAHDQGRVLRIFFHTDQFDLLSFEVILFAFAKNFIAVAGKKKMSFLKPKEIAHQENSSFAVANIEVRSFQTISQEWLNEKGLSGEKQNKSGDERLNQLKKQIDKKQAALEKMQFDILQKTNAMWKGAGEWLKMNQSLDVPREFAEFIDSQKTLSQNIALCFQKAKDQERKLGVAKTRAEVLAKELEILLKTLTEAPGAKVPPIQIQPKKNFLQKVGAQARTLKLDEQLVAYIGKSAQDNLDILRRAQPFDLWIHLRDIPSAHVVIRKTRDRQVTDAEIRKVGAWLITENFGKKAKEKSGETFDLIICECRYVKPIRGDRLGRVNYQNDRTLRLKFDA